MTWCFKYQFKNNRHQSAIQKQVDYNSFDSVEQVIYFGTNQTNQNSIQEEIKNSLNSRNVCYNSEQKLWPFRLICKI